MASVFSNPTLATAARSRRSSSIVVPKMAEPSTGNDQQQADNNDGEMERQLVSSLAKLQQLETMIHHLRTLLPERLLEPLVPIVNPRVTAQGKPMPKSPQMLYEQLSKAARDGVAEVTNFQTMWRGPEMRAVWEQVDAKARENNGVLLQPTGMWERDYDVLLERLVREEEGKREGQRREMEEMERERVNESADGNWRKVVDGFVQRSGGSGVRVVPSKGRDAVTVMLVKAGMTFEAQLHAVVDADGVHEWRVSNKVAPGRPVTKLESAICECLNSRPRQWDLSFLLDMISSYTTVKQTPCAKCTKMTDATAQLPTIRRQTSSQCLDNSQPTTWEAFHPTCLP